MGLTQVPGPTPLVRCCACDRRASPMDEGRGTRDAPGTTDGRRTKDQARRTSLECERLENPSVAIAELLEAHAAAVHDRQQQVGHRRVELVLVMAAHPEPAAEAAGHQRRQ